MAKQERRGNKGFIFRCAIQFVEGFFLDYGKKSIVVRAQTENVSVGVNQDPTVAVPSHLCGML